MIVQRVIRQGRAWQLIGPLGEQLTLPTMGPGTIDIGVLGVETLQKTSGKLDRMASALASLGRPVVLVDTRLDGQGAKGAWGPLEFSTLLPERLGGAAGRYTYFHLPCMAPPHALQEKARAARKLPPLNPHSIERSVHTVLGGQEPLPAAWRHWKVFSLGYKRALTSEAILAGRALAEGAQARGGVAIFLSSRPHLSGFDRCPPGRQDDLYSHRYALATAVGRAIKQEYRWADIRRLHLTLDEQAGSARY